MAEEYDVIVIGAGAAGEHAAGRCTDAGLRTAVVEHELVGGECSYWACMPSKTLLRPGQVITAARRVPGAAQAITGDLDVGKALARRDWMTAGWDDKNQVDWLAGVGATLVRGCGRLVGERCVEVEARDGSRRRLSAAQAVILATGSTAAVPPSMGCARSGSGTAARSPRPSTCLTGSWSWAAGQSGPRWPRPGAAWAVPRSPWWRQPGGCCPARSHSPGSS